MAEPSPPPLSDSPSSSGGAGQFSLRSALVMTGIAAVAFAILFALPPMIAGISLLCSILLVPTAILVTIVYGKGYARAFAIGASIPAFLLAFWFTLLIVQDISISFDDLDFTEGETGRWLRILIGGSWACDLVCGCIGMIGRLASQRSDIH